MDRNSSSMAPVRRGIGLGGKDQPPWPVVVGAGTGGYATPTPEKQLSTPMRPTRRPKSQSPAQTEADIAGGDGGTYRSCRAQPATQPRWLAAVGKERRHQQQGAQHTPAPAPPTPPNGQRRSSPNGRGGKPTPPQPQGTGGTPRHRNTSSPHRRPQPPGKQTGHTNAGGEGKTKPLGTGGGSEDGFGGAGVVGDPGHPWTRFPLGTAKRAAPRRQRSKSPHRLEGSISARSAARSAARQRSPAPTMRDMAQPYKVSSHVRTEPQSVIGRTRGKKNDWSPTSPYVTVFATATELLPAAGAVQYNLAANNTLSLLMNTPFGTRQFLLVLD